jgi:uncharacterized protein DUF6883
MKLPNVENAVVEHEKITEYLLNAAHPDNGGKAVFFEALGFRREEPQTLAKAMLDLARRAEVRRVQRRRMGASTSLLAKSNRRVAERQTSGQSGLSTRDAIWLDWLPLIRTEHEG